MFVVVGVAVGTVVAADSVDAVGYAYAAVANTAFVVGVAVGTVAVDVAAVGAVLENHSNWL